MRVLALAGLAVLLAGASASPQDLGAAAAKEKERRKKLAGQGGQSYTSDDLASAKNPSPTPAPCKATPAKPCPVATPVPAATPLPAASDDSAARKQLEAGWRTRAQRARQSVTDTAARVATLEQQVQQLAGKSLASTDTFEIMRLRQQRESLEAQLKEARAASQKAVEQLGGLEDEARRAGVPPGWIR